MQKKVHLKSDALSFLADQGKRAKMQLFLQFFSVIKINFTTRTKL